MYIVSGINEEQTLVIFMITLILEKGIGVMLPSSFSKWRMATSVLEELRKNSSLVLKKPCIENFKQI